MDFENERINEAKLWLKRAKADLKMANLALDNDLFPECVYHSQQTSEKALKVALILFGEDIQEHKVANIFDDLFSLKYDYNLEKVVNDALELERHWLMSKYPIKRNDGKILDPNDIYGKSKAKDLFKKSNNVLNGILNFLKKEFDLEF